MTAANSHETRIHEAHARASDIVYQMNVQTSEITTQMGQWTTKCAQVTGTYEEVMLKIDARQNQYESDVVAKGKVLNGRLDASFWRIIHSDEWQVQDGREALEEG